jgi:hypothetical protein
MSVLIHRSMQSLGIDESFFFRSRCISPSRPRKVVIEITLEHPGVTVALRYSPVLDSRANVVPCHVIGIPLRDVNFAESIAENVARGSPKAQVIIAGFILLDFPFE